MVRRAWHIYSKSEPNKNLLYRLPNKNFHWRQRFMSNEISKKNNIDVKKTNIGPILHKSSRFGEVKLDLRLAKLEEKQIVANLIELYTYDFTELWDFDIGNNGLYGYKNLDRFWSEPNCYAYLININDKLAGTALVQGKSPIAENKEIWDIAEFFIMKKFRSKGIGRLVAHSLWKHFEGEWQIRVISENLRAKNFWHDAIKRYTLSEPNYQLINHEKDEWIVYQFNSTLQKQNLNSLNHKF